MKQKHRLLVLFLKTLYISAFTFGGGFVIVTFMKKCFVDELHWIDEQEMLDFTALAQSCPGAIAVNGAILVGWKVYGLPEWWWQSSERFFRRWRFWRFYPSVTPRLRRTSGWQQH